MSTVTLRCIEGYSHQTLNYEEGKAYLETLEKGSALYQEISLTLFQRSPGMYTCQDVIISTIEKGLLGGGIFGSPLIAAIYASKNPAVQKECKGIFESLFNTTTPEQEERSIEIASEFDAKLEKNASPKKEDFNQMLSYLEGLLTKAIEQGEIAPKFKVAGYFEELHSDQKIDKASTSYQNIVSTITSQVNNSKNVLIAASVNVQGSLRIGDN